MPNLCNPQNKVFPSNMPKQAVKYRNTHVACELCSNTDSIRFTTVIPAESLFLVLHNQYRIEEIKIKFTLDVIKLVEIQFRQ